MTELVVTTPDGAKLRARRHGQGRPLVLVSGLGGTAGFWDPAIALLGSEFELITFDQRGIAGSSRGSAAVDIAQLAADVLTVCDAMGVENADFLGHSTGGCIVQTIAATAPDQGVPRQRPTRAAPNTSRTIATEEITAPAHAQPSWSPTVDKSQGYRGSSQVLTMVPGCV